MKICPQCRAFFRENAMTCRDCAADLNEVSLKDALTLTQQKSHHDRIQGKNRQELPDSYKQYHIRCYLKDCSFFLDFDLYKNRLKHGQREKRFFIAPVRLSDLFNIPWFFFNVISSNMFHLEYTEFCPRCESKYIKGRHTAEECDYNIEYFSILDDILSGRIVQRKVIYEEYSRLRHLDGLKSAYHDLFYRPIRWEILWDILSVGLSVGCWLYAIVYISFPWFLALLNESVQSDSWSVLVLH